MNKSRRAPKYARRAAAKGVDVLFVWGGDGSVQRCIDAVAGTDTAVAILPAGTANLLAGTSRYRTIWPRRSRSGCTGTGDGWTPDRSTASASW